MILAIRTDSAKAELHLIDNNRLTGSVIWEAGRELSSQILTKLRSLLKKNKLDFEDLTGVVVFKGPGSFTGLRIGVSVANTLAYGLQIPVTGPGGNDWLTQGAKQLAKTKVGQFVVPEYGAPPNITKPKK